MFLQFFTMLLAIFYAGLLSLHSSSIEFGKHTYGNPKVLSWGESNYVKIGSYCSISFGVSIMTGGEHRPDWVTTYPFPVLWKEAKHLTGHPKSKGNVIIGNDVWIAHSVLILSGVTIGDGAVIGASAVVSKNVPPYAIVAGNPAKIIRYRFNQETIVKLLAVKWWDWPEDEIKQVLPLFCSNDIETFLTYCQLTNRL